MTRTLMITNGNSTDPLHQPLPTEFEDTKGAYRAAEKLLADKRVRAIGVSNFSGMHLDELMRTASVTPAVNQVEVHPFARALLHDEASADDVAQETWLLATAQRPNEARQLRPWLARVVRNRVRTRRRGEARRREREAAYEAADGRAVSTPAELVERVELQRVVAGEVLALADLRARRLNAAASAAARPGTRESACS